MKLNVALSLLREVRIRVINMSDRLSEQYKTLFKLSEKKNIPHVTVYAAHFPDDFKIERFSQLADGLPFEVATTQVATHQGYVGVELARSKELLRLHKIVLETLAPRRIVGVDKGESYGMNFTPKQKEYTQKYGYADAMDLYNPHFTITRFEDDRLAEMVAKEINWNIPEFTISELNVYESGKHGVCRRLVGSL